MGDGFRGGESIKRADFIMYRTLRWKPGERIRENALLLFTAAQDLCGVTLVLYCFSWYTKKKRRDGQRGEI